MISAQTFSLDGRLALVTGSSAGIGRVLAQGLAQAGASVVINGRNSERVAQTVAEFRAQGLLAHACAFDTTDAPGAQQAVAQIERDWGAIDILVNNAGITRRAPFTELAVSDWQAVQRTNVDGLFFVAQAVTQQMVKRGRGKVINICSVQSEVGRPGLAAYATSKGAVKMLTKAMAIDLAPHGIQVNAIGPGYFKTELTASLVADEKFNAWLTNRTPQRRWGELPELAPAAVFLASDAASFVNGHVLYVDGGITATL